MSSIVLLIQMRKTISKNIKLIRIFTWSSIHTGLFSIKNGHKEAVFIAPHFTMEIQQKHIRLKTIMHIIVNMHFE